MGKVLGLGLVVLAIGVGILLFGPDGIVSKCPLFSGSGVLASACSDAIAEKQAEEEHTRSTAELIAAVGTLLTGVGAVGSMVRRR